jgi:hypothetical protein
MAKRKVTDADLVALHKEHGGSPTRMSAAIGMSTRALVSRMRKIGIPPLPVGRPTMAPAAKTLYAVRPQGRLDATVDDGVVLVGSDCHYWPGIISTAHRAFVRMCAEMRPRVVVLNGDVFDGASNSRHGRIEWEKRPSVVQELRAVEERLAEIEAAAGGALLVWTRGNHCMRFETALSAQSPQYEGVQGFSLSHHFPAWKHCMALFVNETTVIKHRYRGGIHAVRNNTLQAGMTTVTGHLHSLRVSPLTDYNGTRYGVDTGTLADPYGDQFGYTELNPVDWRSGFAVLTYCKRRLLWPELVHVMDEGQVEFRGQVIEV